MPLSLDDWDELGSRLPCLVNLKPSGEYLMEDFFYAGGLPAVALQLDAELPHHAALEYIRAQVVTQLAGRPLRAVAQLRKGHLTLEPLDGYFDGLAPPVTSDETSLRLLHTRRVVLIGGAEHKLSPQVYGFLKVLEDADGDEVPKREIARALGIPETFRYADIKKRHKAVFDTFVQSDDKGHFWLRPEFLILERG